MFSIILPDNIQTSFLNFNTQVFEPSRGCKALIGCLNELKLLSKFCAISSRFAYNDEIQLSEEQLEFIKSVLTIKDKNTSYKYNNFGEVIKLATQRSFKLPEIFRISLEEAVCG